MSRNTNKTLHGCHVILAFVGILGLPVPATPKTQTSSFDGHLCSVQVRSGSLSSEISFVESMEKLAFLRTLCRSTALRSSAHLSNGLRHHTAPPSFQFHRTFFSLLPSTKRVCSATGYRPPLMVGGIRSFCEDTTHFPVITDPDVLYVFKDIMAASWDELPDAVISDVKKALAKNTDDKAGQEALANLFRAAEAAEEFGGILVSLRMAIDDSVGLSGENVKPMPDEFVNALQIAYKRYTEYLDAFGPEEAYLRKKVETELGTKMIHLKMRCSGLGSEWGKVTVLGTSGLSGSYVEQRAS